MSERQPINMAINTNMCYAYPAMDVNARAMEHLEKMWRNRAEIHEMLEKLELKVRALEEKRHVAPPVHQVRVAYPVSPPVHQVHVAYPVAPSVHQVHVAYPVAPPVHQVRVAYHPVVNVPRANVVYTPPAAMWVQPGYDISKVDPIFREAAKDKNLKLRFMDCTDLAMQCAFVRHRA